ncbi:MAG: hypothetical protein HUU47_08300 [Bacteroidetes bacterium]|nr:hypothetical protein [Bacteroidota bacterium]
MSKESIHNQIRSILEKFKVQNENLEKEKGKISQLEIDLLRKYCIDLYDLANDLSKTDEPSKETPKKDEPPVKEVFFEPKTLSETEKSIETKEVKTWDPPKFEPINEKAKAIEIPFEAKTEDKEKTSAIIDVINETNKKTALHETFSNTREKKEMVEKFANSKISKIIDAIDISKRFELQHNLFKSDNRSFTDSINSLENAGSIDMALKIFDHLAARYHWDTKNDLVKEFKSFIYRKY